MLGKGVGFSTQLTPLKHGQVVKGNPISSMCEIDHKTEPWTTLKGEPLSISQHGALPLTKAISGESYVKLCDDRGVINPLNVYVLP